ncbi:hypothetical protein GAY83_14905 [Phocaeicola vulgatus]|nr:hypothetical protein GAY83_14905 [Phocaeicola vulgatus]
MCIMDLNNIVGFKAVDKNGNERQVTVDEMTELVSARIVSAASEISTFAAAAAAGTDEFEDQLPQSDTFSWLRTLDGSKNPTLTSSSAAAKVLGELLPIVSENNNGLAWKGGFIERAKITSSMSIDDYTNPGMYGLDGCQDSPYKYGGLIVFKANVLVVQIVYEMQGSNRPKYRQNWFNQGWQSWYSF